MCVQLGTGTQTVGTRRLSTVTVGLVLPQRGDQIGQGIKCQLVEDCRVWRPERWNGCSLLEPTHRPCGVLVAVVHRRRFRKTCIKSWHIVTKADVKLN